MSMRASAFVRQAETLIDLLLWRALHQPNQRAYSFLVDGETDEVRLTYSELDRQAKAIAVLLKSLAPDCRRALLVYPPGLEYVAAFFGCLYAGVVAVPVYPPRVNRSMLQFLAIVADTQATVVLTTTEILSSTKRQSVNEQGLVASQWLTTDDMTPGKEAYWQKPEVTSTTLAFIQYTSGSTSTPKGVMLSHANLLHNLALIQRNFEIVPTDSGMFWLPPYHDMGLIGGILEALYSGGLLTLMSPASFLQRPLRWLEAISRTRTTISGGPNFAYELCVQRITPEQRTSLDLSHWNLAFIGAEPVRPETLKRFAAAFAPCGFRQEAFYPCYGLAEATLMVSGGLKAAPPVIQTLQGLALEQGLIVESAMESDRKIVGCGQALPDHKLVIVDPTSLTRCQPDRLGEVWIAGPSVAQGYWDNPKETERTFRAYLSDTGEGPFLRSGDLGFLRDGELFVVDRLKDLIIIRGRNHYPLDIELTVYRSHPLLRTNWGAAVSVDIDGEERLVVVQEVERRYRPHDEDEVVGAIRQAVAKNHALHVYAVVLLKPGSIPKTTSGKIRRHACRAGFLAGSLDVVGRSILYDTSPTANEGVLTYDTLLFIEPEERLPMLEDHLRGEVARLLRVDVAEVDLRQPLVNLGLDSLMAIELKTYLESNFGVVVPEESIIDDLSIARVAKQVLDQLTETTSAPPFTPAHHSSQGDSYITMLISISQGNTEGALATIDQLSDVEVDSLLHDMLADEGGKHLSSTPKHSADASPEEKRALLAQLLRTRFGKARSLHPPSYGQRALWFMHQLASESSAYVVSFAARIDSDLDIPALQRAFQGLVNRHPVLRTTFTTRDGEPTQQVHEDVKVYFEEIDAPGWSEDGLNHALVQETHQPFDLEQGPVLRIYLYTRSAQEHILLLAAHHIAVDAVSIVIFLDELRVLYAAEKGGTPASLPPLDLQYTDYVRWQASVLAGPEGERLWEYWKQQLTGDLPVLNLTKDQVRPPVQTFQGAVHSFTVDEELTQRLKFLARTEGVTLYMILLAAFKTLLYRYTGQEDILVGSPMVCRGRAEFERIVGYFINPVVLRTSLSGNPTFKAFLGQVRQTVLGALAHRDYPFLLLVERLQPDRNPSISLLFQIMFNMPKVSHFEEQEALLFVPGKAGIRLNLGELRLDIFAVEQRAAMFDLMLSVVEVGRALSASFQYNTDLFNAATIARMEGHYQNVLESIVRDPAQKVANVPLLTSTERQQLLIEWNSTQADLPRERCFHQLFEAQVERTPDAVAAVFKDEHLSYQQLNRRANRLAAHLVKQGVGSGCVVAVLSERDLDLLTTMIAVFKAGGAYLPLDPGYPAKRLLHILDRSKTPLVLAASKFVSTLTQALASTSSESLPLVLQIEELLQQEQDEHNLPARCTPGDLAYVIYTSGSTGEPKGAMIEHRGMLNHLYAKVTDLHLTATDSIAQTASQCFDISVWQFLAALPVGGRVHIFTDEIVHDPAQLIEQTRCQEISILEVVPSLLQEMLDEIRRDGASELSLRWLILTGETLPPDLCRQWLHYYPNIPLMNAYGPTECSDDVTHYPLYQPPTADVTRIPIGRPIANTRLYVLDSHLQSVPIGVTGELYVGGIGVGRGYLHDAKRTDEVFVPDPFAQEAGSRLYKTGDLAYYRPDGNIEFLGRIDHQVKVRGFRIELGEIEAVLGQHPAVQDTVVMARENAPGERRLVAYVVANQPAAASISELRSFLKERIPDYMVPSRFVFLDSLPLTPNGKVDRRALPMPDTAQPPLEETLVAPRTHEEEILANIWGEVLGLERVSIHDNFFELGGHSVLAARLIFRVREALQIELPLHSLFEKPTVAGLARAISDARSASRSSEVPTITDLNAEVTLDLAVCPETVSMRPLARPTSIFLTGATGFLGAFLLHELLQQTSADIYCLVRCPNTEEGRRRIQGNLEAYSLWDDHLSPRIIPVPGDLSRPLLGMSAHQFQMMASKIDIIYHNGALVDFTVPYSTLKASNVTGTEEVLRLACQVKVKPVHFVSTISVFQSPGSSGIRVVREQDDLDLSEDLYDGYSQSKWVAEKLVTIARSRGLPVAIYRPGTITGHSQTGVCETKDFICRVIKGCIQLGSVPDLDLSVDMTPVDYVSKALVYLSMREESYGKAFHLNNPRRMHWNKLVSYIRSLGYVLEQVSTDKWVLQLLNPDKLLYQNVLYPLLPHFSSIMVQRRLSQVGTLWFDHQNTIDGLTSSSISCPPVDTDLLSTYFAYFVGSGYLDPGERSVSSSGMETSSEQ